jgi:hypothetical protein
MAVSIVSDPESEQELAEIHLMLKSAWFCFRISSSFVGNKKIKEFATRQAILPSEISPPS